MQRLDRWICLLIATLALGLAAPASARQEPREIRTRLSELSMERELVRVQAELFRVNRETEIEVMALIETHRRIRIDGDIDLRAWEAGEGPWELRELRYRRSLIDNWVKKVTADRLRDLAPGRVLIDDDPYEISDEVFELLKRLRRERDCTISLEGRTHILERGAEFRLHQAVLARLCKLQEEILD